MNLSVIRARQDQVQGQEPGYGPVHGPEAVPVHGTHPCTVLGMPHLTDHDMQRTADVDVPSAHDTIDGFDGPSMYQWDGVTRFIRVV